MAISRSSNIPNAPIYVLYLIDICVFVMDERCVITHTGDIGHWADFAYLSSVTPHIQPVHYHNDLLPGVTPLIQFMHYDIDPPPPHPVLPPLIQPVYVYTLPVARCLSMSVRNGRACNGFES